MLKKMIIIKFTEHSNSSEFQRQKMQKNEITSTILVDPPTHDNDPDPTHPLFYYKHRSDYLTQLSQRYATQYRLPTMDLKRNAKVDYYLSRYTVVQNRIKKEEKKKNAFLKADEFQTIFTEDIDGRRKQERQRRERQKLKNDLEGMWFQEQRAYEPPEKDKIYEENAQKKDKIRQKGYQINKQQQEEELQYRPIFLAPQNQTQRQQKQRYLLDLQIGKIKFEQNLPKLVHNKLNSCQNEKLLTKMSNNILSAYMVHFDEIYSQLMDEILQEQVLYLNYIQAEYKIEKDEWNRGYSTMKADEGCKKNGNRFDNNDIKVRHEDARTLMMMEMVRKLDQLCDQQ